MEESTDTTLDTAEQEDHWYANELFAAADTVLFGRTTYQGFTQYWYTLDLSDTSVPAVEVEFARIFRRLNRVVFSRTMTEVDDRTLLINDNIMSHVEQLSNNQAQTYCWCVALNYSLP